ncbi:MAG: molybdopterin molybdotransferase MoeA [Saprospirales bacterium]|nr:molybdopterin molybdotransferase MoeA [Saprospirales bacterium]
MLSVEEATQLILQHPGRWGVETVPLSQAWGRVLAEPLIADRDFPPFNRASMDGIAIDFRAFSSGSREFAVQAIQAAGMPPLRLENAADCLEIMTGAILPDGTDTVIRYEDLDLKDGRARLTTEDIRKGQNAHLRGADRKEGEQIAPAGTRLGAAELGIAATIGKTILSVFRRPRIALIATGDELVPVESSPLPHQVRTSNIYALQGLFQSWHIDAALLHISDDREEIRKKLGEALDQHDVLVLSGGVSAGKFDYVPEVLEELGVRKIFHKVQQRPGKPFWFGVAEGKTVFALPGNPVSSFMCTVRYIQPWLRSSLSMQALTPLLCALETDYSFTPSLTFFLQVKVFTAPDGRLIGQPRTGKGSGDLANLADADGFLELPASQTSFPAGSAFPLWLYRSIQD